LVPAVVAAAAVGAAFAAVAGLEVVPLGLAAVEVIALLLAGAVLDAVGAAAVGADFAAVAGDAVLPGASLAAAPLLTPP
jgi:hypothetical protein